MAMNKKFLQIIKRFLFVYVTLSLSSPIVLGVKIKETPSCDNLCAKFKPYLEYSEECIRYCSSEQECADRCKRGASSRIKYACKDCQGQSICLDATPCQSTNQDCHSQCGWGWQASECLDRCDRALYRCYKDSITKDCKQ
jgi:hypothetical protein